MFTNVNYLHFESESESSECQCCRLVPLLISSDVIGKLCILHWHQPLFSARFNRIRDQIAHIMLFGVVLEFES